MLIQSGVFIHQGYLGFCHILGKYSANPHAPGMHMQHDLGRLFLVHVKVVLQYIDDEIHGGIIVIQQ